MPFQTGFTVVASYPHSQSICRSLYSIAGRAPDFAEDGPVKAWLHWHVAEFGRASLLAKKMRTVGGVRAEIRER